HTQTHLNLPHTHRHTQTHLNISDTHTHIQTHTHTRTHTHTYTHTLPSQHPHANTNTHIPEVVPVECGQRGWHQKSVTQLCGKVHSLCPHTVSERTTQSQKTLHTSGPLSLSLSHSTSLLASL